MDLEGKKSITDFLHCIKPVLKPWWSEHHRIRIKLKPGLPEDLPIKPNNYSTWMQSALLGCFPYFPHTTPFGSMFSSQIWQVCVKCGEMGGKERETERATDRACPFQHQDTHDRQHKISAQRKNGKDFSNPGKVNETRSRTRNWEIKSQEKEFLVYLILNCKRIEKKMQAPIVTVYRAEIFHDHKRLHQLTKINTSAAGLKCATRRWEALGFPSYQ